MNKKKTFTAATLLLFALMASAQNRFLLTEGDLSLVNQPYGVAMKNRSVSDETIKIRNTHFDCGIGTTSQSQIRVNTHGDAVSLDVKIGVTKNSFKLDETNFVMTPLADGTQTYYKISGSNKQFVAVTNGGFEVKKGKVKFVILGDNEPLYSSSLMDADSPAQKIELNIAGVKLLELKVEDGGDGMSGDCAVWIEPTIGYKSEKPVLVESSFSVATTTQDNKVAKYLTQKAAKLNKITLPLEKVKYDWLLERDRSKAEVYSANGGKDLVISNGLVGRVFRISPYIATIEYTNQMSGENMLRAVSNEGVLKIDGKEYPLGGVEGQFEFGYLKYEWLEEFGAAANSFMIENFTIAELEPRIAWAKSRWAGNPNFATGKRLTFIMSHSSPKLAGIKVKVNYEIYDKIPVISKWIDVENSSKLPVTIDEFKSEQLAFVEPDSPVELEKGDSRFLTPNIHIESDWAFRGFIPRETDCTEYWVEDPRYTSQCNYPMVTPCLLEVKLPMGPNTTLVAGENFSTFRVWEMPFDSYDRERKGLFTRMMYRTISPWTTENPIFMHCTSADDKIVREAIDQCAATGYEMVILSFGSGLNMEDESEENYAKFRKLTEYAESKGIELGGYSLLSSRWISDEVDVINPETGKRGGMIFGSSPCLSSEWGYDYFRKIKRFYEKTGMRVFENDGSYPGNVCASTTHAHHKGLLDSQWEQRKQIENQYKWMCENGIYTNIPDYGYMHNGGTKVGIGYREVNWSLPRERQLVLGRQINYDGTWERIPSMCWTFVPLVQYHGGGDAATLEPLSKHLKEYKAHMIQNYGAGIQACYRGHRLYDTDETKRVVKECIAWYKEYRDILNSDIIHLRRADGRDWDGFMHVNPNLEVKGYAILFNPTDKDIEKEISLPLYYTGIENKALIEIEGEKAKEVILSKKGECDITIKIEANSFIRIEIK